MIKNFIKNIRKQNLKIKQNYTSLPKKNNVEFLSKLTEHALDLYERENDIKKFTKMTLSENNLNEDFDKISNLKEQGLIPEELFNDDFSTLIQNKNFLNDINNFK